MFRHSIASVLVLCSGACSPAAQSPSPSPPPAPTTPAPSASTDPNCAGPAPGPGYVCRQDCGPPVARVGDPPPGYRWLSAEQAQSREQHGCPICLPRTARIATPRGDVAVEELRVGDPVYSLDRAGRRVSTVVLLAGSTHAPANHVVVRVHLGDGRVVTASPGHPSADGRRMGELAPGDTLDHAHVTRVEHAPLMGDHTFDIRPAGETGAYWADGVLIGSTLH